MTWRSDNLSATALTNIALDNADIYCLVEIDYPSAAAMKCISTRTLTQGTKTYTKKLLEFPMIEETLSFGQDAIQPSCYLMIDDSASLGASRWSTLFRLNNPRGCIVRIYTFINANGAGASDRILDGVFKITDYSFPEPYKLRIELVGLLGGIETTMVGRVIEQPDQVNWNQNSVKMVPDATVGKIVPIVFGGVREVPLLAFNQGASSRLSRSLLEERTVGDYIYVGSGDAGKFDPNGGRVQVESEIIYYSGYIGGIDALVILQRNNPTFHAATALVAEVPKYWAGGYDGEANAEYGWIYLVADHRIKGVSNVRINGRVAESQYWNLVNYQEASNPIKYKSTNVAAVVFSELPRITAATHTVLNSLVISGQHFAHFWSIAGDSTAIGETNAFGDNPSLATKIAAPNETICAMTFTGDMTHGASRYGYIKRVFLSAVYAANQTWIESDSAAVVLTARKAGSFLIDPVAANTRLRLPPPSEDDFKVSIPEHYHDISVNLAPDGAGYTSTTELFAQTTDVTYERQTLPMQSIHGSVPQSATLRNTTFGWWVNYAIWANVNKMVDADNGTTGLMMSVTGSGVTGSAWPIGYGGPMSPPEFDDLKITLIPQRPTGGTASTTYSRFGAGANMRSTSSESGRVRINLVVPGVGSFADEFDVAAGTEFKWRAIGYKHTFTKQQLESAYIEIAPVLWWYQFPNWTISGARIEVQEFYAVYDQVPDVDVDLNGAHTELEAEAEAATQQLSGLALSRQITKQVDITAEVTAWADAQGVDPWTFFSGGTVDYYLQMLGQADGTTLALYDGYFEIEYEPLISLSDSVDVTADIEGLCSTGDYLYTNPASVAKLLLTDYAGVGFGGLSLDSYCDDANFLDAYQSLIPAGGREYHVSRQVIEQTSLVELIYTLIRESRSQVLFELGKFYMKFMPSYYAVAESTNAITEDDILSPSIALGPTPINEIVNKLTVNNDWNFDAESYTYSTDRFKDALIVENESSQNEGWGVKEKQMNLYWHNMPAIGKGGTLDLAEFTLVRGAYERISGVLECGLKLLKYSLGDIIHITHEAAGLNAVPCMITSRTRTAPHRVQIGFEFQSAYADLVWEDPGPSETQLRLGWGQSYLYAIIHDYIVSKTKTVGAAIDANGNLYCTDEIRTIDNLPEATEGTTPIWFYGNVRLNFGYSKGGGVYGSKFRLYRSGYTGECQIYAKDIWEEQDLSGYSTGGEWYSSDTNGFALSLNKTDVVFYHRASDGVTLIKGRMFENYSLE